ncbi:MAG: ATP-binding cassette domain-containing protein [Pseudomonadota bacterium]
MLRTVLKQSEPLATITDAGLLRSGRWLVRGVSMALQAGEIVTLIGPNGAGKSTTAKLVLGVLKLDEGSAWRRPGLCLSYVPQRLAIDWTLPLSVGRFMSLTGPISDKDAMQALAETEVTHLADAQMQTLSGGEFQRVLLARAIARKPELLVLDEPVQGVDFAGEVALYDLIRRIRDRYGCGILLISHNLHLVMAATDRVICLNGHVCCSGTPKVVAASAEYKALFGARAASILAVYEHHHDHTHLPDGRVQFTDGTTASNEDDGGGVNVSTACATRSNA